MKPPKKTEPKKPKAEEVEVEPDAWDRFQRTMDKVVPPKRKKPRSDANGDES